MKPVLFLLILFISSCSPKLTPDHNWAGQKWVLTELSGVPVQLSGTDKDAHLVFSPKERSYSGSGGCNRIMGAYAIDKGNKIKFNNPAGTRMACPDIRFEEKFIEVLSSVENYGVSDREMFFSKGNTVVLKFQSRPVN
jgi:heat shock protein HslJ